MINLAKHIIQSNKEDFTPMLQSDLCDYSHAYTVAKWKITALKILYHLPVAYGRLITH